MWDFTALTIDQLIKIAVALVLGTVTATLAVLVSDARVRWNEVGLCTAGRVFGVAAAMALLAMLSADQSFNLVFGSMIVAAVGLSVAGWRLPFTRANLVAMGGVSGVMGTITSVPRRS